MGRGCARPSPRNKRAPAAQRRSHDARVPPPAARGGGCFVFARAIPAALLVAGAAPCHAVEMALSSAAALHAASNGRDAFAEVPAGTRLDVDAERSSLFMGTNWVAVAVPRHLSVWVHGDFAPGGRVGMNNIHVRAGAGTRFRSLGVAAKGTELEVRGTLGEWLRVAPPESARAWVDAALLQPVQQPAPAVGDGKPGEGESPAPPAALAGALLSPNKPQGCETTLAGVADWPAAGHWNSPATLAVWLDSPGEAPVVNVLLEGDVSQHVGARVTARGTLWWLAGQDAPLVLVEEWAARPFSLVAP